MKCVIIILVFYEEADFLFSKFLLFANVWLFTRFLDLSNGARKRVPPSVFLV